MLHRNRNPIKAGVFASVTALAGMLGTASGAIAQGTPPVAKPSEAPKPKELSVTPRAAPMPALRYRLLPLESERTPGDAAPIYLRLEYALGEEGRKQLSQKPTPWLDLPFDQFPVVEARKFVDSWGSRLEQIEFGSRRQTCNWNYTLPEQRERAIEILLSDVSEMRTWVRLLAVKARVEIAEHKDDDAIRTLETGLAFSRHLAADGPFLINQMVGIASAYLLLDRVEELVVQPNAPNLYWSLTALPRPLIDLRRALETEQKLGEWLIPEITELDRVRTEAEWGALFVRLHARMRYIETKNREGLGTKSGAPKIHELAGFRAELAPVARGYLRGRDIVGSSDVGRLSDDQVVVLYVAERYRETRDFWFKSGYLPYADAAATEGEAERFVDAEKSGPMSVFVSLLPNLRAGKLREAQLDRRIAMLRIVEALRMHAHENGGELPKSLDQVKIVPIPINPVTGKDFEYHRDGNAAVLGATPQPSKMEISYRITVRK